MLRPDDISAVFEWVELLLIKSLKRNLSRHKQEEQDEGFNWTAWQAEKLRNVDTFRRQSKAIMDRYTDVIDSETRELLEEQFAEGVNGADVPPAESVPDTPAEVTPEPHFFGVDKTKVNKLIEDVSYLEKNAETAALRLTDDVYRQTVNRVQFAMSTGSISYGQAVDMAVADFLTQGINCIEYKDGRRVNIADYVRMVLRTTSARAALQGKSAKFKAQGYDTVLVSSYGMCSKTCLPWQGRAYIEDTFSYWDGEVEERNGILYGKSNYCGKWFPLLSSAIEKGLFHPNCRHSINQYIDGVTKLPEPIDNSDSERRYKEEQVLRSLEREVRKAKRKVEGFTDAENIKKAKAELREAQKNVREYIAKVNAEEGAKVLARNPLQEKIYEGDVRIGSSAEPVHAPESLPANVSDGHSVEVDIPAPDNGKPDYTDTPIPKNVHNSSVTDKVTAEERKELLSRNKVDIAENAKTVEKVSAVESWEAENYKNSTEKGLLILPDGTTKDFGGIEHHVTGKEEDIKLMDGATFTHNHPTDNTFSQNDIVTGLVKGNLKEMRAVTSTGDVHILVNNGATEQQRKKFNVDYQQRRMKAANVADAKIRRGEKFNKDEYVKSRLETFMSEHAEEYNLSYSKTRIDVNKQSIDKSTENGIISGRGSGNEKSTNEEHTFEKVGEIDFSDKKAIAKSLQEFELKYKDSRIEHCRVFCTNGEVYEVHGDLDTVGTTLLGDKLKGSINEHNHVTGRSQYSFSWDDIKTSVEDGSSIVMAFDEKYRYSMVFSGEKIDLDEIEQVYIDYDNEVGDINALSWQSKKIKPIKDEDYQHEVVRRVCERFGVKYERKRKV